VPPPPPVAQIAAPADTVATGSAAAVEETPPAPAPVVAKTDPKHMGKTAPSKKGGSEKPGVVFIDKTEATKKPAEAPKGKGGKEGEPNFDDLLKEAGVNDPNKKAAPKLDKKSLSGADIKSGMSAIAGKVSSCYAGTQGSAAVKLSVAPSGQVQKVTVSGQFAGTPVAACVEAAVRGASFPAWDGAPQSFGYSYLLSE